MRSKSKMINYGIVYGLSAYGMADRLDIPQEEAAEFIERYMAGFPAVARFIEETIAQGTEHGYVSTLFGRRRQVPELRARRWEMRKQGERFAVNMVIQGTAADIMKVAMVRCDRALTEAGLRSRLVLQIHDELLFEGPAERGRGGQGDRRPGDGRRLRARPAAGGGGGHRLGLAVGQVALAPAATVRLAARGDGGRVERQHRRTAVQAPAGAVSARVVTVS